MRNNAFTLTEVLITIAILAIVIALTYSSYSLSQKAYRESEISAEITQNGRVILERITREIRQAREIATELSQDEPAEEVSPAEGIEFEDGHIDEPYHYIHYFKDGIDVRREVLAYYFSGSPGVYVPSNAVPPAGETLELDILEDPRTIGEYIADFKFWGTKLINISLSLEKNDKTIKLETKVFGRNF